MSSSRDRAAEIKGTVEFLLTMCFLSDSSDVFIRYRNVLHTGRFRSSLSEDRARKGSTRKIDAAPVSAAPKGWCLAHLAPHKRQKISVGAVKASTTLKLTRVSTRSLTSAVNAFEVEETFCRKPVA